MLATLERPAGRPLRPSLPRTGPAPVSPPARTRLIRLAPVTADPAPRPPALSPVLRTSGRPVDHTDHTDRTDAVKPLRMTVRARRLLAGVVLFCCAAGGVVAVDVLSALVPFTPSTSYAAQEAPYVSTGEGTSGFGALVPAAGSSITVAAGDTLWSLAERVAPDADPRDVIAAIMALNDLATPILQPGQVLLLP